ncbi:DUF2970 domain-containing protein [Salinimonas lutimaris]|uniref:DUF2970 domain-containing protein n=1 Tax=Salinimonas lutimaris TaxID=914153 RepID=UPI001E2EBF4B|nr:DUF2970 domain-containing protein [Salinimonas lutimaris]
MMVSLMPHRRARAKRFTPVLSGSQPGFLSIVLSVLASAFGVQSQQNYQRDFSQGNLVAYLVIGVLFVALLVAALAMLVLFITRYYG